MIWKGPIYRWLNIFVLNIPFIPRFRVTFKNTWCHSSNSNGIICLRHNSFNGSENSSSFLIFPLSSRWFLELFWVPKYLCFLLHPNITMYHISFHIKLSMVPLYFKNDGYRYIKTQPMVSIGSKFPIFYDTCSQHMFHSLNFSFWPSIYGWFYVLIFNLVPMARWKTFQIIEVNSGSRSYMMLLVLNVVLLSLFTMKSMASWRYL